MASKRRTIGPLQCFLLGAGLLVGCKNAADSSSVTIADPKPIITAPANIVDFPLIQNTASPAAEHCDQAVLNGIAAMPGPGGAGAGGGAGAAGAAGEFTEFLLTGKGWRFLHHVRLAGGRPRRQPARLLVPAD